MSLPTEPGQERTADAALPPDPFTQLTEQLIAQLETNAYVEARATVTALLRLKPDDPDALDSQAFVNAQLATAVGEVLRLVGHTNWVNGVAFAPGLRRAASASGGAVGEGGFSDGKDRSVRLWDLQTGAELHRFKGHGSQVLGVAWSPARPQHLASCSRQGSISLWDLDARQLLGTFQRGRPAVNSIVFSPDSEWLLSGGDDRQVRLWHVENQRRVRRCDGHEDAVTSVAFTRDSARALSASLDRTIRRWNLEKGEETARFELHEGGVLSLALAGDGKLGVSGGADGAVVLWNATNGKEIARLSGHKGPVNGVAIDREGRRVVSGGADQTLRLWDVDGRREVRCFTGHRDAVKSVALAPAGDLALSGSADGTVRLWRLPR